MEPSSSPRLLLASASPRRTELLALTGWPFDVLATDVDERPHPGEAARDLALRLAREKAGVAGRIKHDGQVVVAADTLVVLGEKVLGKPKDESDARRMLGQLRGVSHMVLTGLAVMQPGGNDLALERCESSVLMGIYSDDEVERYLTSGLALDKAGAYGIQDVGFALVDRQAFRDCLANVMGLPLCHLVRAVGRLNLEPPRDVPASCQNHLDYACPVYQEILS